MSITRREIRKQLKLWNRTEVALLAGVSCQVLHWHEKRGRIAAPTKRLVRSRAYYTEAQVQEILDYFRNRRR